MSIKGKILAGHGIALMLMGVVLTWAVVNLSALGDASNAILQDNYRSILAAEIMLDALERQDSAVLLTVTGDPERADSLYQAHAAQFYQWLGRAKDNITIPRETIIIDSLETQYAAYIQAYGDFQQAFTRGRPGDTFQTRYRTQLLPLFQELRQATLQLRQVNESTMYAASDRAEQLAGRALWSTLGIGIAGILLGLIGSYWIASRITRPLQRMMAATQEIAQGDYDTRVPEETGDELGELAQEFNTMTAKLAEYHNMNIQQIVAEKQKNEAILQSIDDPMVVIGPDRSLRNCNEAAIRLFDLRHSDVENGPDMQSVLHDKTLVALIDETITTKESPVLDETHYLTVDRGESPTYYAYAITPVLDTRDELIGVVLLLRDITRLKELDRRKSEFVMAASHELKTPLTSIGMSIGYLREYSTAKLDADEAEMLETAHAEIRRLKSLVEDLLELSRIETGQIAMETERFPVRAVIDRVENVFTQQMSEQSVTFTVDIPENLPHIHGDPTKITWVVTNLLSNALRYVETGGQITLSARHHGDNMHIAVTDDGAGIPPEYQSRIFQKFVQVPREENQEGSGLGLAICKEIIRAHGGTIWVDSTVDEGSTFTFTLPAGQSNNAT